LRGGTIIPSLTLKEIKVVDVHCHPYLPNLEPFTVNEFIRKLSLSVIPSMFKEGGKANSYQPYPGTNMFMQIMLRRLSEYYLCDPNWSAVVNERNKKSINFSKYTQELFDQVGLSGLVVDFGYPTPRIDKQDYIAISGTTIWEVYRIEPVMVSCREECNDFSEFIEKYRADLREALGREGVIGLKTIIAYRSGLEISEMDESNARNHYKVFQDNDRAEVKALRDYCFHIAMEECTRAQKAMHIHTGIGDGEVVMSKASPSFLLDTLRDEKYKETLVHLVHGGYPWVEEAAFIVSILPNVYMDISLQNPFAGHGVSRIISQVLEFAPFNKVMYGSDAFTVPEMNWLGIQLFKECFEEVLQEWIDKKYMSTDTALYIGEMVLFRNFEKVYKKYL
jgi:predicted TIM-barrel fold metal-dependent hydrolase